ncbi:MAG TPA: helical backbone metal receptor [Thermoanaerobaculia bacterium]|nr:helical backbone metal receptor [Thermoanaerobaculia bacterium]
MTVTDALGQEHRQGSGSLRIISLVPSITETLFDLGVGDALVGVTDFCIFPAEMPDGIARVGGTKNPAVERIRSLKPDLVHVNLEENLEKHAAEIRGFSRLFASEPKTVEDVVKLITDLGQLHDCRAAAARWSDAALVEASRVARGEPFSFACPIWKDPWMWCGGDTYVSSLVETAGGRNVLAGHRRYPGLTLSAVLDLAPGIIFLPDEPYAFSEREREEIESAAPATRVIGPFPGHLFTWHGTRTIAGLRYLRETLRP